MLVAAIYDIHGNLPALEAVLDEIRSAQVDLVVVGGDVVPGPMPCESLDCLREFEIPCRFIIGNTDREVLAQTQGVTTDWFRDAPQQWREPVSWTAQQLTSEQRRFVADWPATIHLEIHGIGNVLFCHATPNSDTEIFTRLTDEDLLVPKFEGLGASMVVCGHTHIQFDRLVGKFRVVNAGSVGMPFGNPGAYWLLLEPGVRLERTQYDFDNAAERISATQFPQAEEFAAKHVLDPPTEELMLAAFGQAEPRNG